MMSTKGFLIEIHSLLCAWVGSVIMLSHPLSFVRCLWLCHWCRESKKCVFLQGASDQSGQGILVCRFVLGDPTSISSEPKRGVDSRQQAPQTGGCPFAFPLQKPPIEGGTHAQKGTRPLGQPWEAPARHEAILLLGGPGYGKTAFCAEAKPWAVFAGCAVRERRRRRHGGGKWVALGGLPVWREPGKNGEGSPRMLGILAVVSVA